MWCTLRFEYYKWIEETRDKCGIICMKITSGTQDKGEYLLAGEEVQISKQKHFQKKICVEVATKFTV